MFSTDIYMTNFNYESTIIRPYVYVLIHKYTKHFYIGSRFGQKSIKAPSNLDILKYQSSSDIVKLLGFENFDVIIIAEFIGKWNEAKYYAFEFEQQLISEYWKDPLLLNKGYHNGHNLISSNDGKILVKDKNNNYYSVYKDDIRYINGELQPFQQGTTVIIDENGIRKKIPLSEFNKNIHNHINKGYMTVIENDTGKYVKITTSEYKNNLHKYKNIMTGKIPVIDKFGNKHILNVDDPKLQNDEFIHINKGRKNSIKSKENIREGTLLAYKKKSKLHCDVCNLDYYENNHNRHITSLKHKAALNKI